MKLLWRQLVGGTLILFRRRIWLGTIVGIPLVCAFFFLDLLHEGLPLRIPCAVVDLDDSSLSRRMTQNLDATELIDVSYRYSSYAEAMAALQEGSIYGFFLIPVDFQKQAKAGQGPTLSFFSNMTYFVPGTLSYKGFLTQTVSVAGGIVRTTLVSKGLSEARVGELLQPVVVQEHTPGNPWINYNYYLSISFVPGVLALMIMLVTPFTICQPIKQGTSVEWLRSAGGSMALALTGRLVPQTVLFTVVGWAIQAAMYGYLHFPCAHPWAMIAAMPCMVVAIQSFMVLVCSIIPNLRLSLSIGALMGILAFSITGFSYPVPNMYGGIAIFAYAYPLRYYFLIHIDQALNGIPLYYSRWYYIIMLCFPLVSWVGLKRLKKHCLNPVYVP